MAATETSSGVHGSSATVGVVTPAWPKIQADLGITLAMVTAGTAIGSVSSTVVPVFNDPGADEHTENRQTKQT